MSIPVTSDANGAAADASSLPMIRLFDEGDISFLRAVPAYNTRMESEFRRRRCRIFKGYLHILRTEFLAAQTELGVLRTESPEDHRQLGLLLLRCRMRFAWTIVPAYLCMLRYRWNLGGAELGPVVQRYEGFRREIRFWIHGLSWRGH